MRRTAKRKTLYVIACYSMVSSVEHFELRATLSPLQIPGSDSLGSQEDVTRGVHGSPTGEAA